MSESAEDQHVFVAEDRLGEDDNDLLTYTEAGIRLTEAIAEQEQRLAQLQDADGAASPATDAVRERLGALRAAQERNSRRAVNDENFEAFFGYPAQRGQARVQET